MHGIKYIFHCLHEEVDIDTYLYLFAGPERALYTTLLYYTIIAIKSSTLYVQLLLGADAADTHIIRLSGICVFIKSIKWCV